MRPSVSVSGRPPPPQRRAMISAAIDTAVSSGVRAPRSRPIGLASRLSSASVRPASRSRSHAVVVGAPRAHHADVADLGQPQSDLEDGHVELRVVGEHADRGPGVDRALLGLRGEVAVGPLDDDLVGGGESGGGGEHRPGVADGHPVAEERGLPGQRSGEVDRAEDQHPRPRRVAGDEHLHARFLALAVGAVGQHRGPAGGEQTPGVVGDRGVGARRSERPVDACPSDDQPAPEPLAGRDAR